jgi:hypothetical protein
LTPCFFASASDRPTCAVYREELDTLMTENIHIVAKAAIPVEYREVA